LEDPSIPRALAGWDPGAQFSSIEEYLGRNTQDYYDVLAEVGAGSWHPERDACPWVRFTLTAHFRQAQRLLRRVRQTDRLGALLEEEVKRLRIPERTVLALYDAAQRFRVHNRVYQEQLDPFDAAQLLLFGGG
jgi:hypothetical protein